MKREIPILLYHSVKRKSLDQRTVELALFEKQMAYLERKGFQTLSLNDFLKGEFFPNSLVLTFDDGFEDNYLQVYPLLRKYGFRATFFLIAHSAGSASFMSWRQIKEMSEEGMSFGSHTLSHENLLKLDSRKVKAEVEQSKTIIEDRIARGVDFFSFPYSNSDERIKQAVKDAGYKAAFTAFRGFFHPHERSWRKTNDLFSIPRLETSTRPHFLDVLELRVKVSGWHII